MKEVIERLQIQINSVGQQMEQERTTFEVSTTDDINSLAPSSPGIYWIETTMPMKKLASAISAVTGKQRKTRKTKPDGAGLIESPLKNSFPPSLRHPQPQTSRIISHLVPQKQTQKNKVRIKTTLSGDHAQ